ncbi:MAG: hypothetical protein HY785_15460 [Oscillatoriophycideae cyanobacterium NC_groundwater_1537_Pr4_S-0.65um_50_18]|nr:hypothetical protein [Oscillatoriophycideae cyanobacterium NC_groundwater_1537_Pr4_S-0.65um_50_18]
MRHLKAKLQGLTHPLVWGSASALLMMSYGLFHYWGSAGQGDSAVSSDRPQENNATAASELENPEFGDSEFSRLLELTEPSPSEVPKQTPPALTTPNLTSTTPKPQGSQARRSNPFNPFATNNSTEDAATVNDSPSAAFPLPSAIGTAGGEPPADSKSERAGTAVPVSPLQSALDRNLAASPSEEAELTNDEAIAPLEDGAADGGVSPTATPLSPVNASQFQPSFQPYVPRTSPPVGSTGYTLPPAFRTPVNSTTEDASRFSNSQPQPLPGYTTAPTRLSPGLGVDYGQGGDRSQPPQPQFSPSQPLPQPEPFSVPRTTPGQSIGGGRINTFSDP